MRSFVDYTAMVGLRCGAWTILAFSRGRRNRLQVLCDCGELASVDAHSVAAGHSTRCRACADAVSGPKNGHGATRGRQETPEWRSWRGMIERCSNQNHKNWDRYGGRGIAVAERWRSFASFLADMGQKPTPQHTIERIDNNRGYEPGNCRWATPAEQNVNKSTSRLLTHEGKTMGVLDWARAKRLRPSTIYDRLHMGWEVARVLDTPPKVTRNPARRSA